MKQIGLILVILSAWLVSSCSLPSSRLESPREPQRLPGIADKVDEATRMPALLSEVTSQGAVGKPYAISFEECSLVATPSQEIQLTAFAIGTEETVAMTWQADRGRVTPDGLYVAPDSEGSDRVVVSARDDASITAELPVQVKGCDYPDISGTWYNPQDATVVITITQTCGDFIQYVNGAYNDTGHFTGPTTIVNKSGYAGTASPTEITWESGGPRIRWVRSR